MKKISLTLLALTAAAGVSFGQGYVAWSVGPSTSLIGETNTSVISSFTGGGSQVGGASGVTVAGGSSLFYYALLVNTSSSAIASPTTASSLSANWTYTGLAMTNGSTANGRLSLFNNASAQDVDNSYTSGTLNFIVVGWSANLVNSTNVATVEYDLANWSTVGGTITGNAFFGVSAEGTVTPTTSNVSGATVIGVSGIYNPVGSPMYMDVLATPEPGTMALAAIGGASLLLFRRRK